MWELNLTFLRSFTYFSLGCKVDIIAWIKKHFFKKKKTSTTVKAVAVERKPELDLSERSVKMPRTRTDLKKLIIAQRNIKRRRESSYKYSKFFKHRQPTTARKLWKPDKKPED